MKCLIFTFAFLASSISFAEGLSGFCYGLPMLANNTDVADWDGRTNLSFEVDHDFDLPSVPDVAFAYSSTLDMQESEGDPVPKVKVTLEQFYRQPYLSLSVKLIKADGSDSGIESNTIANTISSGKENGMNVGLNPVLVTGSSDQISCYIDGKTIPFL